MRTRSGVPVGLALAGALLAVSAAPGQPYDFSDANDLLIAELPQLDHHVAVIVRQNGHELYRFQFGDIDYGTKNRLASFTKTISAGVILALVDEQVLALDERIGDSLPLFESNGLGDPTVLDAWAMRHGINTAIAYEHDARFTLRESVARIGATGYLEFAPPGSRLGYDGAGMQTVGWIAEWRLGQSWEDIARSRIFDDCNMPQADYQQFDPNPAVAGGLRSSAVETMAYAQMILDEGWYGGKRLLSEAAIEQMFTNHTRGLPVHASPWPQTHPDYPYGVDPDYAFGSWVLAEHPQTRHVEEIVGAGAWGSYLWIDRRRGLTAVLITDVQPGTQKSMDAALGLCTIARREVEAAQNRALCAVRIGDRVLLRWQAAAGATATRVYGSAQPIRDVFDLRRATLLMETVNSTANVPSWQYFAVTAVHPALENTALIPRGNALVDPTPTPDLNDDGAVDILDFVVFEGSMGGPGVDAAGDVDGDHDADVADFFGLQRFFGQMGRS